MSSLHSAQMDFASAIRDPQNSALPKGVSARSMRVYHELFFNNFVGCLQSAFPILHEVLPETIGQQLIKDFFQSHQSHTAEFPRLPGEFVRWLETRQSNDDEPAYIYELALWEWIELDVSLDESEVTLSAIDTDKWLDAGLSINPTLRLLMFDYPVHQICEAYLPDDAQTQSHYLAAWRTADHQVEFMELAPASAIFLQLMIDQQGVNGAALLQQFLRDIGQQDDDTINEFAADFVRELVRRQIITGLRE